MKYFSKLSSITLLLVLLGVMLVCFKHYQGVSSVCAWVEQGGERPRKISLTSMETGQRIEIAQDELIAELTKEVKPGHFLPDQPKETGATNKPADRSCYYEGRADFGPMRSASFNIVISSVRTRVGVFGYPRKFNPFEDWGYVRFVQSEAPLSHTLWDTLESAHNQ